MNIIDRTNISSALGKKSVNYYVISCVRITLLVVPLVRFVSECHSSSDF